MVLVEGRTTLFVIFIAYTVIMLYFSQQGKQGKTMTLRRIQAIDAMEEAVSRAVELGKPVHWTEGHPRASKLYDARGVYLVASLAFLSRIAQLASEKGARLISSVGHPELYPVVKEVVSTQFTVTGNPDNYLEEDIQLMPEYSYLAAVVGRLTREKPAAHIQIGYFWGQDSVAVPEVAQGLGAFSINGGQVGALQYLVVLSDYILIADELFAASAQITNDPVLIMDMVGLDLNKGLMIALVVLGTLLSTLGISFLANLI
jgi:hypothetical protein